MQLWAGTTICPDKEKSFAAGDGAQQNERTVSQPIHGQEDRSCPPSANQGVSKAEPIGSVSPVELVQPWQYWFLRREKWHCWDSDFQDVHDVHDVPDEAISFPHREFGKTTPVIPSQKPENSGSAVQARRCYSQSKEQINEGKKLFLVG